MSDAAEDAPAPLDAATLARRDAALAHVRAYGDPVLRERARPVATFDDALREEVETMTALMDDALGFGLAATQVGILHRVLVYRVPDEAGSRVHVLVNPGLEWSSEERERFPDGCLSLPGVWVDVERPAPGARGGSRPARRCGAHRRRGPRGQRRPARDGPPRRGSSSSTASTG